MQQLPPGVQPQIPPYLPGNGGTVKQDNNFWMQQVMFHNVWGGICSIVAGIFMWPFFCYGASLLEWSKPSMWAAIGFVMFLKMLAMVLAMVKPFARKEGF